MRNPRRTVFTLFLICILLAAYLVYHNANKLRYNEEGTIGNTAGNLYNGGLFCERDGIIYFSNPADDGALYSMKSDCTDVKKLSEDKAASINADSHYVYYSRRNYQKQNPSDGIFVFRNTGLYRIRKDGSNLAMLFDGGNGISVLAGNTLYYQHYDTKTATRFYSVGIDGKDNKELSKDALIPASVRDGILYYAGVLDDHYLHAYRTDTGNSMILSMQYTYIPIAMPDGIYYISTRDGYSLHKMDYSGSHDEVIVSEFICTYNMTADERYLFYQIDGGNDNRLVVLDRHSGITKTIADGDYKQLHITENYLFFRSFDESETFAYNIKTGVLNTFHPPVLTLED